MIHEGPPKPRSGVSLRDFRGPPWMIFLGVGSHGWAGGLLRRRARDGVDRAAGPAWHGTSVADTCIAGCRPICANGPASGRPARRGSSRPPLHLRSLRAEGRQGELCEAGRRASPPGLSNIRSNSASSAIATVGRRATPFFFPIEEYEPEYLDALAELCRAGFGEVEIHLHHDHDTPGTLRAKLARIQGNPGQAARPVVTPSPHRCGDVRLHPRQLGAVQRPARRLALRRRSRDSDSCSKPAATPTSRSPRRRSRRSRRSSIAFTMRAIDPAGALARSRDTRRMPSTTRCCWCKARFCSTGSGANGASWPERRKRVLANHATAEHRATASSWLRARVQDAEPARLVLRQAARPRRSGARSRDASRGRRWCGSTRIWQSWPATIRSSTSIT